MNSKENKGEGKFAECQHLFKKKYIDNVFEILFKKCKETKGWSKNYLVDGYEKTYSVGIIHRSMSSNWSLDLFIKN